MARLLLHKLKDALAEVCLNDVYAVLLEEGVHLALLRQHRLALHELLHVVRREYFKHNVVKLFCVFCPVNLHSVLLGICGKLLKIFVKMRDGVALYGAGRVAQAFPLVKSHGHIVALVAQCPERGVVPLGVLSVLQERLCCFSV